MQKEESGTALLIMDLQAGILGNYGNASGLVSRAAAAIGAARKRGVPVIFVVVGFRPGMPEANAANKTFGNGARFAGVSMDEFMRLHPDLGRQADDVLVVKRRISAFTGSDLDLVLRSAGIQHLVLAGLSTGGVVLSTLREAADKDYRITVLADACGDADEEVHRVLTTKVFPRQAEVVRVEDWAAGD